MNLVPAEGSKQCLMAIVGEAPGQTEELIGRPFVGQSGQLLIQKLHNAGIARQDCYITNVVKSRPPANDFSIYWNGKFPKKELLEAREYLLKELCDVRTNVILALGANALWALTGETKIGNWRGSILSVKLPDGREVKVIPTYHPAAALREYSFATIIGIDIAKAKRESSFPELNILQRKLLIAPTQEDVLKYITACLNNKYLSFDIETSNNSILCLGIGYTPDEAMCIPTTQEYWGSWSKLKSVLDNISDLFEDDKVIKIAQNMTYDIQYMMRLFRMKVSKPWNDTMIMQHSCYSELPKSLAFLASIYTNEPYYKDDLKVWNTTKTDNHKLWEYNAKDVAVTLDCFHSLNKEIDKLQCRHTYDYMMELLEPLLYMMLSGVNVNFSAVNIARDDLKKELEEAQIKFKQLYGEVNPMSPKQLASLAKQLNIKIPTKKGKITMDKDSIEKIAVNHPAFAHVSKIRNTSKLISTYLDLEDEVDQVDKKLRFSINSTGTVTGRLSSSESVFWYGINMQNVPKKIRHIIIPNNGMVFTEADLIGAEAMVVAYESNDPLMIKVLEEGGNIHKITAGLIWGVTPEQVDKEREILEAKGHETKTMYFKAKRVRHSGNYLGSWVTLSEQLKISAAEAKQLLQRFYQASPNLSKWHAEIKAKINKDRILITPLGRKRLFFGRINDTLYREAIAYVPQETVAHIINVGIIKFYNEVCKQYKDINVKLQVHDSVLIEHPPEMTEFIHIKIHELFKVLMKAHGRDYSIPLEIKTGENWRDLKKIYE